MITPKSGNPAPIARYISVDLFGGMLIYMAVVAGGLGFWRYEMIRRERAARIAAENWAIAIQQQAEAERRQSAAERQQAAVERERFMASITEERQQAAAERERFMMTIDGLAAQVTRLVQERNGNHGGNDRNLNEQ